MMNKGKHGTGHGKEWAAPASPPYEGVERSPSGGQGWFSSGRIGRGYLNRASQQPFLGLVELDECQPENHPSPKRRHPSFVRRGA